MKVILPLKYIEDGKTVTKPTGEKKYTVCRSVKAYAKGVPSLEGLQASKGVVFLIASCGTINAVPESDEVAVHGTALQLCEFMEQVWEMQDADRH